ncbi:butyrophilin subfamily 1 member A1-like [Huso huso]|uniref:Butyrophilin subfamily 1 member A1-like n=1 Tax=Huso huso TaxID=61971 RepID=A0ABR0YQ55_HUSHU
MKQWMLLLCFSVLHSTAEATSLKTSDSPVKGTHFGEVSLPCSLSPISDATPLSISWLKKPSDSLVYSYHPGSSTAGPSFEGGRANIDLSKLTRGDLTLTLLNLTFADEGTYLCQTTDSKGEKVEKTVELKVGNIGQRPSILLSSLPTALSISLSCQSPGWAPAPQVSWIGGDGSLLGEGKSELKVMDQGKLIMVINKMTINAKDEQKVTCSLRNTLLDKEMHETVIITGDFPPSVSPWLIVFIVLLLILGVIAGVVFWQYSKKREAIRGEDPRRWTNIQTVRESDRETDKHIHIQTDSPNMGKRLYQDEITWQSCLLSHTSPATPDMKEGFCSGNPYWEVAVREKDWTVGVIEDGMDIKTMVGWTRYHGRSIIFTCPLIQGVLLCALSMKGSSQVKLQSPNLSSPSAQHNTIQPPQYNTAPIQTGLPAGLGGEAALCVRCITQYKNNKQRLYTFNTFIQFKKQTIPFCL